MMDSSPQSSLPSPPSSPASSFSSLPSSLFDSLPASPPFHSSPLPLVVQHDRMTDTTIGNSYIILGSQPSSKSALLDFLQIQAVNIDFDQSDNVYNILTPVYNVIFDRFQTGLSVIPSSYTFNTSLLHPVLQFRSHFFTAAILVLSSLKPTLLERRLISTLSQYIPVIPVVPSNRTRRSRLEHPQPLTPSQLRTVLSHSPQALYRIQQKAVHCFLIWHYSQSTDTKDSPQSRRLSCYHQHSSLILDPFHLPSLVSISFSLCKSLMSSVYFPPRIFTLTMIGAFCAGVGVGCYLARG